MYLLNEEMITLLPNKFHNYAAGVILLGSEYLINQWSMVFIASDKMQDAWAYANHRSQGSGRAMM